jgi:peptidyl-prolyl cis-trans isomerase SurA
MKTLAILTLAALLATAAIAAPAQTTPQTAAKATNGKPVLLDKVIAIVNGQVLLQSDVDQEKRLAVLSPLTIPNGQNTDVAAAHRLIRRTLMLEQMEQQGQPTTVSRADAEKGLKELRAALHLCTPYSCSTQKGWDEFLKDHDITEQEALERWSQRMAIENFINLRFRTGIHISQNEISTYYNGTLVPALQASNVSVPPLKQVSSRIEQLLLEQHVNTLIAEWLQSLRAEGSVQILVPAYGQSSPQPVDSNK